MAETSTIEEMHITLTEQDDDGNVVRKLYPLVYAVDTMIDVTGNANIPDDLKTVQDLVNNLGSAASYNATDFATAEQGKKAASALQLADLNGAVSTIVRTNFVNKNCVIVSNSMGKCSSSTITTEKLGYIKNLTSDAQSQINDLKNQVVVSADKPAKSCLWFKTEE